MPDTEPMSDEEIVDYLTTKAHRAMNRQGGGLSETRKTAFDYYIGEKYGTEVRGKSEVVTRECFEVVEEALAQVIPAFTSSRMAEFEAVGPEDEAQAQQETDVVNYFLTKKNNGFMFLYEWFKDAIMYPNGYSKANMREVTKDRTEQFHGLTQIQLAQIMQEYGDKFDEMEVVEHLERQVQDPNTGQVYQLFDVTIEYQQTEYELVLDTIPGEEMLVDNDLLGQDMDESVFNCHRYARTKSSLLEEGFDPEQLDRVGGGESNDWNDERVNRLFYEEESPDSDSDDHESVKDFWVYDCDVYLDVDGDGIAEPRHIVMIGNEIFVNEVDDYRQFCSLSSIPMQHKHNGMSQIDVTQDLQLIKSTLFRQYLTNIYRINQPKKYVGMRFRDDEWKTMDYLLNAEEEFVPCKDPTAINAEQCVDLGPYILPAMDKVDAMVDSRTGIGNGGVLDPDVLQKATEGAVALANDARSKRVEAIVRIFAETGVKQMMLKVHRLLREYQDVPLTIKLRNEWVNVNPANWKDRVDVTVNIGLGTNNKNRDLMAMQQLMAALEKVAASPKYGYLITAKNIFNTMVKLSETLGLNNPEMFMSNPDKVQPPQPPPNEQLELAKAQMELAKAEQQRRNQQTQVELQIKQMQEQHSQQREIAEFRHKQTMDQMKAQMEQMKQVQAALDAEAERRKTAADIENTNADTRLTAAKTVQTYTEVDSQEIENDAVVQGVKRLTSGQAEPVE